MDKAVKIWIVLAIFVLIALFATSCKTVKEPGETRVEYIDRYIDRLKVDSIFRHDSIYIRQRNDTIYEYREIEIYRNRYLHDTIHIALTDTITRIEFREVEKEMTGYDKAKMEVGKVTIPILILLLCAGIGYAVKKFI